MLIGLVGYAGAGKDTVAGMLPGFERRAFADKLRALALAADPLVHGNSPLGHGRLSRMVSHYGWDRLKREWPEVRRLLQDLGEGVRCQLGRDTWVDAVLPGHPGALDVVITDVRYPNEAARILALGGVIWVITRPGVGPVNNHDSEGYASWIGGYVHQEVVNGGTLDDLRSAVEDALDLAGVP